jgi:hypothetical protein
MRRFILLLFGIGVVILIAAYRGSTLSTVSAEMPNDETRMIDTFAEYARKYDNAGNAIMQGRVPQELDRALCELFPSPHVKSWKGKINYVTLYQDGDGGLVVNLNDNITLTSNLKRPVKPAIAQTLETFNIGGWAVFSGNFYLFNPEWHRDGTPKGNGPCVDIGGLTESGRMHTPSIIFEFTSLAHLR